MRLNTLTSHPLYRVLESYCDGAPAALYTHDPMVDSFKPFLPLEEGELSHFSAGFSCRVFGEANSRLLANVISLCHRGHEPALIDEVLDAVYTVVSAATAAQLHHQTERQQDWLCKHLPNREEYDNFHPPSLSPYSKLAAKDLNDLLVYLPALMDDVNDFALTLATNLLTSAIKFDSVTKDSIVISWPTLRGHFKASIPVDPQEPGAGYRIARSIRYLLASGVRHSASKPVLLALKLIREVSANPGITIADILPYVRRSQSERRKRVTGFIRSIHNGVVRQTICLQIGRNGSSFRFLLPPSQLPPDRAMSVALRMQAIIERCLAENLDPNLDKQLQAAVDVFCVNVVSIWDPERSTSQPSQNEKENLLKRLSALVTPDQRPDRRVSNHRGNTASP